MSQKVRTHTYRDIDLNFGIHPLSGDINTVSDDIAVKRALKNLIFTRFYERPFHPEKGCIIHSLLFEPIIPPVAIQISESIREVIDNFEPRAHIAQIQVIPRPDENGYDISVAFFMVKQPQQTFTMALFLEKLR